MGVVSKVGANVAGDREFLLSWKRVPVEMPFQPMARDGLSRKENRPMLSSPFRVPVPLNIAP